MHFQIAPIFGLQITLGELTAALQAS